MRDSKDEEYSDFMNYDKFYQLYETSWIIRTCIDTIVVESTRPGWYWKPKFAYKCESCELTFNTQHIDDKCPKCGNVIKVLSSKRPVKISCPNCGIEGMIQ